VIPTGSFDIRVTFNTNGDDLWKPSLRPTVKLPVKPPRQKKDAFQRLEAQRQAHLRLLAKAEADRQKAKAQVEAEKQKVEKEEVKQKANLDDWSVPQPGDDWSVPQPGKTLVSWTDESPKKSSGDDASTVASETSSSWLPPKQKTVYGLYFHKAEAEKLKKVKAALRELDWLQKQVDAGKKMELDPAQYAKIHGKHAEKRRKQLEESDVLRMERAGYQVRDRYG